MKEKKIKQPIVIETSYSKEGIKNPFLNNDTISNERKKFILDYPTVYIIHDKKKEKSFSVYVGESSDIYSRTNQHLLIDSKNRKDWNDLALSNSSQMFIIGHHHFNKSLTLDIENRLMLYLSGVESVETLYNRRTNQQNNYYTADELDIIFTKVWAKLGHLNKDLFPIKKVIEDSAIFKASPFHKLTEEQMRNKDSIYMQIVSALTMEKSGQLILVEGEAGTGKTVLMSSLFFELSQAAKEPAEENPLANAKSYLIVNHDQQLKVYKQIASKLGVLEKNEDNVTKPTHFINHQSPDEKVDVVIVDEAHLLWTQGKQSYRGKNQLTDLMARAKVVVAVFDRNQILATNQYWEQEKLLELEHEANLAGRLISLKQQMRINADEKTVKWIRDLIDDNKVTPIPKDKVGYDLQIFNTPGEMENALQAKALKENHGISRMVATFDWQYIDGKKPDDADYWRVQVGDWSMPWNLQLPKKTKRGQDKYLSWAEQAQTIDEIGSTFTIQGFDLNYVGVVIGPSVKYRDGKIIYDKSASANKNATQRRTLQDGTKEYFSDILLKNELNVLLTRGVNGLYIYAVDDELRAALQKANWR